MRNNAVRETDGLNVVLPNRMVRAAAVRTATLKDAVALVVRKKSNSGCRG